MDLKSLELRRLLSRLVHWHRFLETFVRPVVQEGEVLATITSLKGDKKSLKCLEREAFLCVFGVCVSSKVTVPAPVMSSAFQKSFKALSQPDIEEAASRHREAAVPRNGLEASSIQTSRQTDLFLYRSI